MSTPNRPRAPLAIVKSNEGQSIPPPSFELTTPPSINEAPQPSHPLAQQSEAPLHIPMGRPAPEIEPVATLSAQLQPEHTPHIISTPELSPAVIPEASGGAVEPVQQPERSISQATEVPQSQPADAASVRATGEAVSRQPEAHSDTTDSSDAGAWQNLIAQRGEEREALNNPSS